MDPYCTPESRVCQSRDSQVIHLSSFEVPRRRTSRHQGNNVPASGRGPGESSEVVLRPLKNQSSSAGVPAFPTTLARPAPRGKNTAYPSLLCCTREYASGRTMAAGGGARHTAPPPSARAHCPLGGASAVDLSHGNGSGPGGLRSAAGGAASILGREFPTDFSRGDVVPGRPRVASPLR